MTRRQLLALAAAAPAAGGVGEPIVLRNSRLAVHLSPQGEIQRIENFDAREMYEIEEDSLRLATDRGTFTSRQAQFIRSERKPGRASFAFNWPGIASVSLEYSLAENAQYAKRSLAVSNLEVPLTLQNVELGRTAFRNPPRETVRYDTFWNAPTVAFLRWAKGGLFAGIENPFFDLAIKGDNAAFSYEPALQLRGEETYESEAQFIGIYANSGRLVADHYPKNAWCAEEKVHRPRFRNPAGHIPLDQNEIRAMQAFASEYLALRVDRFLSILYCYWYPIEQLPQTEAVEAKYRRMIDTFRELGGDMVIFNPLARPEMPTSDPASSWTMAPAGSPAERILAHAADKGLKFGFYMGVAAQGDRGNACALPFAPEHRDWKKVDMYGEIGQENCMASDAYAGWWFAVQRNTIAKYGLSLWSWDPGPGNGLFCHSDKHGHLPGKGGYKGWRNATALIRRLKDEFPGLYIQGFYGRKEYGLWGLKYFDQHEAYWEQTVPFLASMHPDLHADRINADGVRLQSWWNENFRFLPAAINHALVHRIQENSFDPNLTKVWDHFGWRYSLMSGLAMGGSVTACILPEDIDNVAGPQFRNFYRKWLGWARENFRYVKYQVTFGDQIRPGGVDGHARIKGNHGFIFLCNPSPRPARTRLTLDHQIGLNEAGRYTLKELYPREGVKVLDDVHQWGVWSHGSTVTVVVPAYEIMLLELNAAQAEQAPVLFGCSGNVRVNGGMLEIDGAVGQAGETLALAVLTSEGNAVSSVRVNGHAIPFKADGEYIRATARFKGEPLARFLDNWRTANGQAFYFPFHEESRDLTLATTFHAGLSMRKLLEAARPANYSEIEPLLERWQSEKKLPDVFTWARPDRLFLVVPFTDAELVGGLELQVNRKDLKVDWFTVRKTRIIAYADLTNGLVWGAENTLLLRLVGLGANQFLGPYLDYPAARISTEVTPARGPARGRVVYDKPVDPEMPVRWRRNARTPVILSASMTPDALREGETAYLRVTTNVPASELQGVYVSTGLPAEDRLLRYDEAQDVWTTSFRVKSRRSIIMDCQYNYVWAVMKDGRVGEPRRVPLQWRFGTSTVEGRKHS